MKKTQKDDGQINSNLLKDPADADIVAKLTAQAYKLCDEVMKFTRIAGDANTNAVNHAKTCGEVLQKIKPLIAHGRWMEWVKHHFYGNQTTANTCMRIAENWDSIDQGVISHGVDAVLDSLKKQTKTKFKKEDLVPQESPDLDEIWGDELDHTDAELWAMLKSRRIQGDKKRIRIPTATRDTKPKAISLFLDSGSFSLKTEAERYAKKRKCGLWDFFKSEAFWKYMDAYINFIKKYNYAIDLYANLDVIGNENLSARNQDLMERTGLRPVPVVHYPEDPEKRKHFNWMHAYVRRYSIIGLGNLVGHTTKPECREWIDNCFWEANLEYEQVASIKLHGFGAMTFDLMFDFPWHSVDSTSWLVPGGNGQILVPRKGQDCQFAFDQPPLSIVVSEINDKSKIIDNDKKAQAEKWLQSIGIKWEEVVSEYAMRDTANLRYYETLRKSKKKCPILYYSGDVSMARAENVVEDNTNVMLTFYDLYKAQLKCERFNAILKMKDEILKQKGEKRPT